MVRYQKILLLFGLVAGLNNCAVVAVGAIGAMAATGAAVGSDPRSGGSLMDDNGIQTKLALKYGNSDDFPDSNIYVDVYNKAVLLTGQIKTNQQKQYAETIAKAYPGVIKVFNYLEVRLPSSAGARSKDALITTQLKAQLFGTSNISSNDIKVETTNAVVYLMGMVNSATAESATTVAAKVGGVDRVVTLFNYK